MPGNILTVGGNYTGRNGLILLQTETGGDNSKTDRLVIKGNASTYPCRCYSGRWYWCRDT
ncbi:autotransporter outer membrane beta-barrel domain-containing protein [Escherichia coli]|nr:autotransporter outer membrane beta-barrel domain-containing protein [Escherichia coli]